MDSFPGITIILDLNLDAKYFPRSIAIIPPIAIIFLNFDKSVNNASILFLLFVISDVLIYS